MAYPLQFEWRHQGDEPVKLGTFLSAHGVSHAVLIQIKFHGGSMQINHVPAWSVDLVQPQDVVTITLPPEPANAAVAISDAPLTIVAEDDNFLIVNKPAGVASVPAHHYGNDTMVNRVKGYFITHGMALQVPHIVTRLDKGTSGIVLFGKHHMAHSVLDKQLKDHSMAKTYLAVVAGVGLPAHGDITAPILRDETSFVKRTTGPTGQSAHTEFWVLNETARFTVVKVRLHTGRTHQIRVHFSSIGHPLVGDELYEGPLDWGIERQALACTDIRFFDPFVGQEQTVHVAPAQDIVQLLAASE
ncbi:RluA family pseudouridine synthase [Furfurilactobacillus entadae]|uniref:RluA family pseudouridine synthase n=1 Tax=Furfurilactobacillus entadae TaxID=2922307 RepID=UPI0035EC008D